MPIEHAIWKVGGEPERVVDGVLDSELDLEEMIFKNISILNEQWLLIGRQVPTAYNKLIDLLALDSTGSLIIIELKRNKTPREVVAQAIDYASWIKGLDPAAVAGIFDEFSRECLKRSGSLDDAFFKKFGIRLDEEQLNGSHQIVIVAAQLDSSTERIVAYLNESNIPINVMFFRVFQDEGKRYLSRAWFVDPAQTQENATVPKSTEPWNGEYYVSFGDDHNRNWEDARRYGFISATSPP